MRIYLPDECLQWCKYGPYYSDIERTFQFNPLDDAGHSMISGPELIVDFNQTLYQHNIERVRHVIDTCVKNYPGLQPILDELTIFMPPFPSRGYENAMAFTKAIIFWPRPTQIPHCMTDYIVAHELGHTVQFRYAPQRYYAFGYPDGYYRQYLALMNEKQSIHSCWTDKVDEKGNAIYEDHEDYDVLYGRDRDWKDHPQEWFAESFRYLFGADTGEPFWGVNAPLPTDEIKALLLRMGEPK